jgi:hypothetical protein
MMATIASVLLVTLVGLFVVWPFLNPGAPATDTLRDLVSPLERQKLEAYAALREAEFDFRMGKLSDADYAALRDRYRHEALAAIAAIEDARSRTRRERPRASSGAKGERRIAFCPACGERLPASANFCGGCGHSLRELVA